MDCGCRIECAAEVYRARAVAVKACIAPERSRRQVAAWTLASSRCKRVALREAMVATSSLAVAKPEGAAVASPGATENPVPPWPPGDDGRAFLRLVMNRLGTFRKVDRFKVSLNVVNDHAPAHGHCASHARFAPKYRMAAGAPPAFLPPSPPRLPREDSQRGASLRRHRQGPIAHNRRCTKAPIQRRDEATLARARSVDRSEGRQRRPNPLALPDHASRVGPVTTCSTSEGPRRGSARWRVAASPPAVPPCVSRLARYNGSFRVSKPSGARRTLRGGSVCIRARGPRTFGRASLVVRRRPRLEPAARACAAQRTRTAASSHQGVRGFFTRCVAKRIRDARAAGGRGDIPRRVETSGSRAGGDCPLAGFRSILRLSSGRSSRENERSQKPMRGARRPAHVRQRSNPRALA